MPTIETSTGTIGSSNPLPVTGTVTGTITGTTGGYTATIQVVPTVQAAAYSSGNVIGGLLTFAGAARVAAGSGIIQTAMVSFTSGVQPSLDFVFFNASPTGSTITDKTAIAVANADVGKII